MRRIGEPSRRSLRTRTGVLVACVAVMLSAQTAWSQSSERGLFVANNGNLEGSVTAFRVNADGTLALLNRIVTGTRPTINDPCPGCNPYEISISPNGRYLATGHAASNDPIQQISVFEIASDGTIDQIGAFQVGGTPMDLVWPSDELLAALRTNPSPDQVVVYRFDPMGPSLSEIEFESVGTFCSYLAIHPIQPVLYVNDSGSARLIRVFAVAPDGTLTLIDSEPTGTYYGLELALSNDGTKLYAAGGITEVVLGYEVAPDGSLSPLADSPFPESGDSPSNLYCSPDDRYLLVGHGTDATLRSAAIDPSTGDLAYTGAVFDVGLQGTLGDVSAMDDLVFVTDNSSAIDGLMGVYSLTLTSEGSFIQNGMIQSTGGIAPRSTAAWKPSAAGVESASLPGAMARPRVFPNPSMRGVTIAYSLERPALIRIEILDVGGRVVRHLGERAAAAGDFGIDWDGADDTGERVASGVYFVRIRSGHGQDRERIVLTR